MDNPLLTMKGLPPFSHIKPEHFLPAVEHVLAENRAQISLLTETVKNPTWDNFIHPLNEWNERLNRVWGTINHLHGVADSEALRPAYNACLPLLADYRSEIGQNQALYTGYQAVADSPEFSQLTSAQRKTIENELRDFRLSGVNLPPAEQARYKEIQQLLSQLTTKFSENLLDATQAWRKWIVDESMLSGLPESTLQLARRNAESDGKTGWVLTLDAPCYLPVMMYLDNRTLRQEIYTAFVTRASDQGPDAGRWDNSAVMEEILTLRQALAHLLGFPNYAEYSLATKMAKSTQQVLDFLGDLATKAKPFGLREREELLAFAQSHYGMQQLEMWDVPYFSEKLRQQRYALSQETLRPYFPLSQVLQGLFKIIGGLYGLSVQRRTDVDVWHEDVQFFDVYDDVGELRGQFYLDPYARQGKRGGAWMDDCIVRKRVGSAVQIPVAYLCCNFTPSSTDAPCLLTHQEVITLFHEFGHGLHHLLTQVDYAPVSGISGVPWDAVELPSQFMENWCWEKPALDLFASHYQNDEPLPAALFEKMCAAKHFQAGLFMLRQLEFGVFDFRLHKEYHSGLNIQALLNEVRQQVAVLLPPAFNRFQHSFSHIFAGGYAAGYYSYKWAEVLSADAFSRFEEEGIFNPQTGRDFLQCILEKGGSEDPMILFTKFRGREPRIDALLKQCGMMIS